MAKLEMAAKQLYADRPQDSTSIKEATNLAKAIQDTLQRFSDDDVYTILMAMTFAHSRGMSDGRMAAIQAMNERLERVIEHVGKELVTA